MTEAYALVDYSEPESTGSAVSRSSAPPKRVVKRTAAPGQARSKSSGPSILGGKFKLKTNYLSESLETDDINAKFTKVNFSASYSLNPSVYFETNYQVISTDDEMLAETSGYQKGNPELTVGVNWLQFGNQADNTRVDLLLGNRWAQSGSDFASSRNDILLGIQTVKKMSNFFIGIGYDLDLTGKPKESDEMTIGKIHTIKAGLGLMVTNDINASIFARRVTVKSSGESSEDEDAASLNLESDLVFTTLNPELGLMVTPYANVKLGGHFRTKRVDYDSSYQAIKLPKYNSLWGNSIYAGLDLRF